MTMLCQLEGRSSTVKVIPRGWGTERFLHPHGRNTEGGIREKDRTTVVRSHNHPGMWKGIL